MNHHMIRNIAIPAALLALFVGGCGKSDSKSASADGPNAAPAAPTAAVSSQGDLVGSWYTTAPNPGGDDIIGLEFGKDAKVMLTTGDMQTLTADYSVLDGGRIRMILPNGMTLLANSKVDSRSLLIDPTTPNPVIEKTQFARLNGQTIAEARKQKQQEAAKRRQEMLAAVQNQLQQPNLALVSSDPKLNLSRFALDVKGSGGLWQGVIYSESNPPLKRQVQISIQQSEPPQVFVDIGQVLGPVGEADRNPLRITLSAGGTPDKPDLSGQGLSLRSDAPTHDALLKGYEQLARQRQQLIDQFADQFKSYSIFTGELTYPNNPNVKPRAISLGLLRAEGKPAFLLADLTRNDNPAPQAFNQAAVIQLESGKPLLILPNMQGVLTAAASSGVITLDGKLNGMAAHLKSTQVLSKEQLVQQRAVVSDFLDKQLPAGLVLSGAEWVDGKTNMPVPVSLELKGDAAHNLSGVLKPLQMGGQFAVTGKAQATLLGAVIQVEGPVQKRLAAASNQLGRSRSAAMNVLWVGGKPQFTGDVRGGFQTGPVELSIASQDRTQAEMAKAQAALAAGEDFVVTDPNRFERAKIHLQLKLDPATGQVSGQSTQSRYWGAGAVTGQLQQQDGLPFLSLDQAPFKDQKGYAYPGRHHELWVLFDRDGGMTLSGWTLDGSRNPPMIDSLKLTPAK